jgi:hypothetical protein
MRKHRKLLQMRRFLKVGGTEHCANQVAFGASPLRIA